MKEYRILPMQYLVHGLKEKGLLSPPLSYELLVRDGIKLRSIGIYKTEEAAKSAAIRHAAPDQPKFV